MLWSIVENIKQHSLIVLMKATCIHLQDERVLDCQVYAPEETTRFILMIHGMNPKEM